MVTDTTNKLNLSSLTYLLSQIAKAIDDGKTNPFSLDDVYREIEAGTIFAFLAGKFGQSTDMSMLTTTTWDQGALAVEALQRAVVALEGRERRKAGVEKNGLALLLALTSVAIQQDFC